MERINHLSSGRGGGILDGNITGVCTSGPTKRGARWGGGADIQMSTMTQDNHSHEAMVTAQRKCLGTVNCHRHHVSTKNSNTNLPSLGVQPKHTINIKQQL